MISLHILITAFVVVLAPGTGVIYTLALGLGQGRTHLLNSERVLKWMSHGFAAVFAGLAARLAARTHLSAAKETSG